MALKKRGIGSLIDQGWLSKELYKLTHTINQRLGRPCTTTHIVPEPHNSVYFAISIFSCVIFIVMINIKQNIEQCINFGLRFHEYMPCLPSQSLYYEHTIIKLIKAILLIVDFRDIILLPTIKQIGISNRLICFLYARLSSRSSLSTSGK